MNKEIKRIIEELESCIGMFDYLITPEDNDLLVLYIKELQEKNEMLKQKNKQLKQENKELHNKIDKAIEYIKRFDIQHLHEVMEHNLVEVLEVFLEILKDSDVDD